MCNGVVLLAGISRSGKDKLGGLLQQERFEKIYPKSELNCKDYDFNSYQGKFIYLTSETAGFKEDREIIIKPINTTIPKIFILLETNYYIYRKRYSKSDEKEKRNLINEDEFNKCLNNHKMPGEDEKFIKCIRCRVDLPKITESPSILLFQYDNEEQYIQTGCNMIKKEILESFNY